MATRKRLGEMLVEAGIIDGDQLHAALRHQRQWGGRLGAILIELKLAGEEAIVDALAVKLGLEIARLEHLEPYAFEQARALVPAEWAVRTRVFPVAADTGHLVVAMSDPTNLALTDELAFRTGRRVKACIAGEQALTAAFRTHFGVEAPGQREAIALDVEDDGVGETIYDPIGATSSEQLDQFFQQGGAAEPAPRAVGGAAPSRAPAPVEAYRDRPRSPAELQLEDQRTESIPLVAATPVELPEEELQPIPIEPEPPPAAAPRASASAAAARPSAEARPRARAPAAQATPAAGDVHAEPAAYAAADAYAEPVAYAEPADPQAQGALAGGDGYAAEAAWSEQGVQAGTEGYEGQAAPAELTAEEAELLEALRRLAAGDDSAAALLPRTRLLAVLIRIMLRRQWITERELLDELLHG